MKEPEQIWADLLRTLYRLQVIDFDSLGYTIDILTIKLIKRGA